MTQEATELEEPSESGGSAFSHLLRVFDVGFDAIGFDGFR